LWRRRSSDELTMHSFGRPGHDHCDCMNLHSILGNPRVLGLKTCLSYEMNNFKIICCKEWRYPLTAALFCFCTLWSESYFLRKHIIYVQGVWIQVFYDLASLHVLYMADVFSHSKCLFLIFLQQPKAIWIIMTKLQASAQSYWIWVSMLLSKSCH
jgi:hypothetical protein